MTNDQELGTVAEAPSENHFTSFSRGKAMKNFCSAAAAALLAVAALLGGPSVAIATPLIAFTDDSPTTSSGALLSDNIN